MDQVITRAMSAIDELLESAIEWVIHIFLEKIIAVHIQ